VKKIIQKDDAVSEIVGEMLMLTMVLIILAVFSSSLSNYLPPPRDPSVTIKMSYNDTAKIAILYHKGGDPIKTTDLTIIVGNSSTTSRLNYGNSRVKYIGYNGLANPNLFDLGDRVEVYDVYSGEISLATSHAVIYQTLVPP
jgi:archaeal type IV pilus assembly protein PilA